MLRDLENRDDVEHLVRAFYSTAFGDPLLGHIFTDVARMDLDHHLPIMCDFWQTVLFRAGLYHRNALAVHVALNNRFPLEAKHFERWLALWNSTVDIEFVGERAERAKLQATRIAGSMQRRLEGRSGSDFESIQARG